jgi:O-antigen ligase
LVALICTLSRTSWVTLLLGSVLLSLLLPKMRTGLFLALVAGTVLFFFFASGSYRTLALQRLFGIFQPAATLSVIQRTEIWEASVRVIADHPFVGVGIGNYPAAVRSLGISEALSAPHNLYFYLLSEFGIIGLGLFLLLVAAVFSKLLQGLRARISKNDRLVVGVLLIGFIMVLVQSTITSYVLREGEIWVLLGITMAAVQVLAPQESASTVGGKRGKSQNGPIGRNG